MPKKLLFNFNREVIQNYTYVKYVGTIITATNTLEKPIKSAILKGNTLVNYSNLSKTNILTPNQTVVLVSDLLKTNNEYTLIFNCTSAPSINTFELRKAYNGVDLTFSAINVKSGINKIKIDTTNLTVNQIKIKNSSTSETNFEFKDVLLIEGDYTNVDIPYFEGMQSVRMPVLMTSGKNLFSDNLLNGKQVKENGKYKAGTSNSKNDKFVIDKLDGKKQYTITVSCITDSWTNFYVKYTNGEGRQYPIGNKSSYIITTNKPPYEVDYMCSWGSSASFLYDIQIEEGSVATSYEPPKSNTLTVNEDVTLRSNGDICDELNLLTGQLMQRIGEDGVVLSQEAVKTVDLSILDQNENKVSSISSFNDTTHITASSETIPPIFEGYLATKEVE